MTREQPNPMIINIKTITNREENREERRIIRERLYQTHVLLILQTLSNKTFSLLIPLNNTFSLLIPPNKTFSPS